MPSIDVATLTRSLVDIDSTTGQEHQAGRWLADTLRALGYAVVEQPVSDGRVNLWAHLHTTPTLVFSTHYDCVPPFFPSRLEGGVISGRGACDAKGIVAAQVAAAEQLRASGVTSLGLLFVVGEELGGDGARTANTQAPAGVRFLVNGEPTDNRLGIATRGVYRVRLRATGRAAHSSFPELGESAIDKLLDALMVLRGVGLPEDPVLGRTHYNVGLIEGGVAPNVVSPGASAELMFRTVSGVEPIREALGIVEGLVSVEQLVEMAPVWMRTLPGFETAVFPYGTDLPMLTNWGEPFLFGPGSIHDAHTEAEHVSVEQLHEATQRYVELARELLSTARGC